MRTFNNKDFTIHSVLQRAQTLSVYGVFMQIYIAQNGQQLGPYTLEQVKAKLLAQEIKLTDMSWHEGIKDWIPLSSLRDITLPHQNIAVLEVSTAYNPALTPASWNASIPVVYAGFWIRFGAWFVDQITLTLLNLVHNS